MSPYLEMKTQRLNDVKYLFDHLDEKERETCLRTCRRRDFSKGEILVSQGDSCQALLIVGSGEVARQRYTSGGAFATLDVCERGCVLGAEILLQEQNHFSYEIEALSSGSLLSLSKESFLTLTEQYPQLQENLQKVLADYIQQQDTRIELLSQRSIRQKIAFYLISQSDGNPTHYECRMPGSKEVSARYFALPRQSLSRELLTMEKENLISVNARNVTILDYEALVRIVDET